MNKVKNKKSNKKTLKIILIIVGIFLVLFGIFKIFYGDVPKEYQGIWYQRVVTTNTGEDETRWACIVFDDHGQYGLYDCDSEPTSYFFDSEDNCTYAYNKLTKKMVFFCLNGFWRRTPFNSYISDVEITYDEFNFTLDGKRHTFRSEEWLEEHGLEYGS